MTDRPCISVVVPFFNSERTLEGCVESLLAQEGLNEAHEIILVDNRSVDGSAAIAARYPEVTLLDEPEPGAYPARNTAVRHASAPVIAFTDADCVADPNWLRVILDGMRDVETAVLLGHCRYPESASVALRLLQAYENAKLDYVLSRCPPANYFGHGNNMAVRASVFEDLGLFMEWQRAGDTELVQRVATRRPDLQVRYQPAMRITHLEFMRGGKRLDRLRLYKQTNSKIDSFRELTLFQRLGILRHLMRGR